MGLSVLTTEAYHCVQTLMDDEKRTDYDSLIGFSRLATNPFEDSNFEQDQVFMHFKAESILLFAQC